MPLSESACGMLAYLVGALADGSLYQNERHYVYRVRYYQRSKAFLKQIIEPYMSQLFDKQGRYDYDGRKGVYSYTVSSKAVYQVMKYVVEPFKSSNERRVPRWVRDGDRLVQRAFVRGFFDADGWYHIASENADFRVRFGQSDRMVLEDVRDFLSHERFRCSDVLGPYQSKLTAKPYYELHLHGRMQMERFHRIIKPNHPSKQLE